MPRRRMATIAIGAISVLSFVGSANAQRAGDLTSALRSLPVDGASLGDPARAYLAFTRNDQVDWMTTGGVGLAGGFLRASFGQGRVESIVGVGYSHPLARQSMGLFGTFGVGVDLAGAYDISSQQSYQSRAARLAIPLSIRWGSPTRFSLTPYVAPYAELGHGKILRGNCESFTCTGPLRVWTGQARAAGLGTGFELTAWRLGFDVGLRDVLNRGLPMQNYQYTFAVRMKF